MSHTPGPWKVGGVDDHVWIERPNQAEACICDIVQSGFDEPHGEPYYMAADHANARLIAAAPELFDIARTIVAVCDSGDTNLAQLACMENSPLVGAARAAIAKAEGR